MTEQRTVLSGGEHPENVQATLRNERRARLAAERRFRIAAEDAERLVTSALSALGHELRPPLAHALDFVARLEGAKALPTSAIADVARGLHSALQVVDDILESSQLEEGKVRLSEGLFSPKELVKAVVDEKRGAIKAKGLDLLLSLEPSLPRAVLGDVVKIRQVLRALIDNAIKFTTSGTVSVRVKRTTQGQLHTIRYEVEDTGFGIEKAHLLQVFQRFHRLRPEIPGAGLGLSICRDLVNLMGGQIGIASVEGQGTLVYFTVGQASPAESVPTASAEQAQGPKVLLVEDDSDNRRMIARFLSNQGFQVCDVSLAQEALESLKKNKFDAIVTDISMPGMDGIDLVAAWRKLEHQQGRKPTPAIVVTAHSISEYQERCRQVGVDVFLTKPVKASTLFRALDRVTKRVARVLVVDDAFDSRMLLETCLQLYPLPLQIVSVDSGKAAVAMCQAQVFDLIFMDVIMNEMDGIVALGEIRKLPGYSDTPVVAATGLSEQAELQHLEREGFAYVLKKPLSRHDIHQVVRDHLRSASIEIHPSLEHITLDASPTLPELEPVSSSDRDQMDKALRDLIPLYLANRRADLESIERLVHENDFKGISQLAHRMKGTGGAYGFHEISEIGEALEAAAQESNHEAVLQIHGDLALLLAKVGSPAPGR